MYINEVSNGSSVSVNVQLGDKKIELTTKRLSLSEDTLRSYGVIGHALPVEALRQDGKLLGFPPKLSYKVFGNINDKPFMWTSVQIKAISIEGTTIHVIISNQDGKEHNRRACYRLFVGTRAVAKVNAGESIEEVLVKDISAMGMGMYFERTKIKVGSHVSLRYEDPDKSASFNLSGIVVRTNEDGNRIFAGCKMGALNSAVSRYVNEKQRERMKLERER